MSFGMKSVAIALALLAATLLAGPASAAVAVSAPTAHTAHRGIVATAHAVHTGVHPAAHRHHRARSIHEHAAVRASIARAAAAPVTPTPAAPVRHPAHHPAVLPHVAAKGLRAPSRGTHPGALGQASPGLGPATDESSFAAIVNDLVTDPHQALLRGRSPPRGDPPSATLPSSSCAPAAPHLRAPSPHSPLSRRTFATSSPIARRTSDCDRARLVRSRCFFTHPDRAPEGGPAGFISPSWRIST
jgi:hypothetical protein